MTCDHKSILPCDHKSLMLCDHKSEALWVICVTG